MKIKIGDVVYYITKYTGIHWMTKTISNWIGIDCGCDQRREKWNQIKINRHE